METILICTPSYGPVVVNGSSRPFVNDPRWPSASQYPYSASVSDDFEDHRWDEESTIATSHEQSNLESDQPASAVQHTLEMESPPMSPFLGTPIVNGSAVYNGDIPILNMSPRGRADTLPLKSSNGELEHTSFTPSSKRHEQQEKPPEKEVTKPDLGSFHLPPRPRSSQGHWYGGRGAVLSPVVETRTASPSDPARKPSSAEAPTSQPITTPSMVNGKSSTPPQPTLTSRNARENDMPAKVETALRSNGIGAATTTTPISRKLNGSSPGPVVAHGSQWQQASSKKSAKKKKAPQGQNPPWPVNEGEKKGG